MFGKEVVHKTWNWKDGGTEGHFIYQNQVYKKTKFCGIWFVSLDKLTVAEYFIDYLGLVELENLLYVSK